MSLNTDNFIKGTVKYTLNGNTPIRSDGTQVTSQFHDTLLKQTTSPANQPTETKGSNLVVKNISIGFAPVASTASKELKTPLMRDARKQTAGIDGIGSYNTSPSQRNALRQGNLLTSTNTNSYAAIQKLSGHNNSSKQLGAISAMFESGSKGIEAIGYDEGGGTCYGTYQISSKQGTMKEFIEWLKEREPSWAARLASSGAANTGSTTGRMPAMWKTIARENSEKFASLQQEFITKNFYDPAVQKIKESTGVDISTKSRALREALFSTAVQHGVGGAERIFSDAIKNDLSKKELSSDSKMISAIYVNRFKAINVKSPTLQASLQDRIAKECNVVLAKLKREPDESYLA